MNGYIKHGEPEFIYGKIVLSVNYESFASVLLFAESAANFGDFAARNPEELPMMSIGESDARKSRLAMSLYFDYCKLINSCGQCNRLKREVLQSGRLGSLVCSDQESLPFISSDALDDRQGWCPRGQMPFFDCDSSP